ncbi:flagellar basal body-associated FliL family protein [Sphingomonas adhaesiva]|uniref:flagellar basal body-associated FliL family protein n=1 Tax=Sphingomonas adhaesiva TaxID=28212 RepID=UPI002FF66D8B
MTIKRKLVWAFAALLIVAAGSAFGIWMQRDGLATHLDRDAGQAEADASAVPADLARQAQPLYYSFSPDITLNVKDSDAVIDAGVSLSTHYAATNDALKNDDPALRSAILMALADLPQDTASSDQGKALMLSRIVTAVNEQLQRDGYPGNVDGAYFTSFVVGGGDAQ